MPHSHPNRQNITVLSGTYYFGLGRTFNKSAMKAYSVLQEDGMAPNTNQMIKR